MDAEKYEAFNCLPAIICVLDGEGNCLFANKAWESFTNISIEDAKGEGWQAAILKEDFDQLPSPAEAWESRNKCEFRLRRADGEYAWITSIMNKVDDVYIKVIIDVSDMTIQLKQAEEKERHATEFLKSVLDGIPDPIFVKDREHKWIEGNKAFFEMFGDIKKEDILGKSDYEFFPKEEADVFWEKDNEVFSTEGVVDNFETFTREDETRTLFTRKVVVTNSEGEKILVGAIRDITEIEKIKDQLEEAEEKAKRASDFLNSVLEGIPDPIFVKDEQHRWVEGNKAWVETFGGRKKEEIIGKSDYEFFPKEQADIFWEKDNEVFSTDGVVDNVEKITHNNLTSTLFTRKVTAINPEGEKILIGAIRDITELEKVKDRLERAVEELTESNEELERFAYIASHDLQEPLRVVVNFTGLLKKRYGDSLDEEAHKYIEFASDAAYRMEALIADLLEYARLDEEGSRNSEVHCEEILEYVKSGLAELMEARGAVVESKSNLPVLSNCNPVRLVQLMQNLITNAIKYTADGVKPKVEISCEEVSSEDGEFWQFSFKDNGIGIEKEYYERIFNPFKRLHTSDEYSGTGIGLAICKKIVSVMEGNIWVESEYGKGSTFYFTIPKSASDGVSV